MKIQRIAAVTVLAACLAAAGCAGGGAEGTSRGDTEVGSSGGRVPRDARRVAEAPGSRLIHRPLREGMIYVVEVQPATGATTSGGRRESTKVIYSGPVRANANVVVDPAANAITVNDQQVKSGSRLNPDRTYRLYFLQK